MHVGFGWPLLDPEDDVVAPLEPEVVVPLDDVAPLDEVVAPDEDPDEDVDVVPDDEAERTS